MNRLLAIAVLAAFGVALSGCATPCCYCYYEETGTRGLFDASVEPRPEIAPQLKPVVVARY